MKLLCNQLGTDTDQSTVATQLHPLLKRKSMENINSLISMMAINVGDIPFSEFAFLRDTTRVAIDFNTNDISEVRYLLEEICC